MPARLSMPGLVALLCLLSLPAAAHEQVGLAGGLVSGLLHPLTGLDHLVAMVAVGIWGTQLGSPAIWLLPITFPLVMAVGGMLGVLGVPLPMTEIAIAASAIFLGGAVALAARVPFWVAAVMVSFFAIFHGHAHGAELPRAANPLAYGLGFVTATGCLHLCGIGIGVSLRSWLGMPVVRGMGAVIAALGVFFLYSSLAGEG